MSKYSFCPIDKYLTEPKQLALEAYISVVNFRHDRCVVAHGRNEYTNFLMNFLTWATFTDSSGLASCDSWSQKSCRAASMSYDWG